MVTASPAPPRSRRQKRSSASTTRSRWATRCGITTPCRRAINTPTTTTPARSGHLRVHRWTRRPESWDRDVFVRLENERYVQGQDEGNSLLLIPGVSWSRLRVRGGLVPDWGSPATDDGVLEPLPGSDISFMRVWGRSKRLRTPGEDHRFLMRAEQGPSSGMISPWSPLPALLHRRRSDGPGLRLRDHFATGDDGKADRRTLRQRRQPGVQLPLQREAARCPVRGRRDRHRRLQRGLEDRHRGRVRWVTPSVRSGSIWRWASPRRTSRCGCTSHWGRNYDPATRRISSSFSFLAAAAAFLAGVCIVIWVKRIFLWLMGLFFLLLIGVSLLGFTHQGNKWLWQQARAALPSLKGSWWRGNRVWLDLRRGWLAGRAGGCHRGAGRAGLGSG